MEDLNNFARNYQVLAPSVYEEISDAAKEVAVEIAKVIKRKSEENKKCVLGLATGMTPVPVYKELVRMHKEEGLSFANVVVFTLDEYLPTSATDKHSYASCIYENLLNHIDIDKDNIFIPCTDLGIEDVVDFCANYERQIELSGGIDFQLLGIGRTGHIGFNEPGSGLFSQTRLVTLDSLTIKDSAKKFGGEANVPKHAITMGINTILKSKRIVLIAWGEGKAQIVKDAIEAKVDDSLPATFLQYHPNCKFVLDTEAASLLLTTEMPWLLSNMDWSDRMIRKAVTWLAQKVDKPVLKLTTEDYLKYGMKSLINQFDSAYHVNLKVFNDLQHTITGWPGGKPNADDSNRPAPSDPAKKRVIVFSPHPDDDVISMGGTFIRLAAQGHDVHVAYHVSGNIAVSDEDVLRYAKFAELFNKEFGEEGVKETKLQTIADIVRGRKDGELDSPQALETKGIIRRVEALNACRFVGVSEEKVHFLDLPFYKTGAVEKKPLSEEDVKIVANILQEVQPHQIYAANDLADPHGTHAVCFESLLRALEMLKDEEWLQNCVVWGYRGAWAEWEIHNVDMAVPLSPDELTGKIQAIFRHQSQKDNVLFPGEDKREFWERARDRNHATAVLYDKLGLAEYEAMEVFSKCDFKHHPFLKKKI